MRWFMLLVLALGLTGCAGQSGGSSSDSDQRLLARAKIHTELAGAYYERLQYSVALEELETALRANSSYAPAYTMRGLVHMALREDREAESDFRYSLNLDANNSDTQNNYGWFLCQRGRERESLGHFVVAAKNPLYETPEKAYLNAGLCSKKMGATKEAEEFLQKALARHPEMPDALVGLADLSFGNGDLAGAKSYFLRFEKAATTVMSAENLLLAVHIERKLGNRNGEAAYAAQLHKHYPDSREWQLVLHRK